MITPREKAKELVDKYFKTIQSHKYHYVNETAKQCALIAVDEILEALYVIYEAGSERAYWLEVKQEIQNL